jgi:hypothetical protein
MTDPCKSEDHIDAPICRLSTSSLSRTSDTYLSRPGSRQGLRSTAVGIMMMNQAVQAWWATSPSVAHWPSSNWPRELLRPWTGAPSVPCTWLSALSASRQSCWRSWCPSPRSFIKGSDHLELPGAALRQFPLNLTSRLHEAQLGSSPPLSPISGYLVSPHPSVQCWPETTTALSSKFIYLLASSRARPPIGVCFSSPATAVHLSAAAHIEPIGPEFRSTSTRRSGLGIRPSHLGFRRLQPDRTCLGA